MIGRGKTKLKQQALYYRNVHSDEKSHLVGIINAKIMLGEFDSNLLADRLDKIFWEGELDYNIMRTTYLMYLIRSVQLKRNIDHALTAQVALMYKLKYRIRLLKYKDDLPF